MGISQLLDMLLFKHGEVLTMWSNIGKAVPLFTNIGKTVPLFTTPLSVFDLMKTSSHNMNLQKVTVFQFGMLIKAPTLKDRVREALKKLFFLGIFPN